VFLLLTTIQSFMFWCLQQYSYSCSCDLHQYSHLCYYYLPQYNYSCLVNHKKHELLYCWKL
jgi:hypothetical protein